jgi:hypothetical protein
MKTYYFECTVRFTDFVPEEDTYYGEECYSGIIEAKNSKQGKADAKIKGLEMFEKDVGTDNTDVELTLDAFYETISEARTN